MAEEKKGICPDCGKEYVHVSRYKNGDCMYVHARELCSIGGVPVYWNVTDSCYVKGAKDERKSEAE